MTAADYMNHIYYGFSYQFCDRSKWNVYASEETNALLRTADAFVEEGDDAVLTPFFLNRERQGEFLPQHMIDHDDEVAEDNDSSSNIEDEEDDI